MSGSQKTSRSRAVAALSKGPAAADFVWNGRDEDDRPLTKEEMREGHLRVRERGRPPGSSKVSTTIRFDADVLEAFRSQGAGWQSRMNAALRDWLKGHPAK